MGGKRKMTVDRSLGVCSSPTVRPPRGSLGRAQSSGWRLESSPAHCAQPAEDPFPEPLQAFRDNEWEQKAKADGNRAFSLLNSPVVLLCSEKEMKGWKLPGGESWTVSCWVTTHFIWNYCQMLFFPSPSHSNSHYFYERFLCNRLKKNRRKFPLVPCRAFCSFPFLLRPCNIGINSLLIEMVMSCWHFITVNVVTVIFNSSSEGGIASPLNTLVFSAAKAGSRCWVNNSYMWVQKKCTLTLISNIFTCIFKKVFMEHPKPHRRVFTRLKLLKT